MTTLADIIQAGYRELNLVAIGKDPTAAQLEEGVTLLNQIYAHVLGSDAGELLFDWPLGNYGRQTMDNLWFLPEQLQNPPINSRLVMTAENAMTVYFPVQPSDGTRMNVIDPFNLLATWNLTLDGNGRTIETASSVTLSTNGIDRTWIYRADIGNWNRLSDLTSTDESPFPAEYDPYFSILMALRAAPRAGKKLAETTTAAFKSIEQKFKARYFQRAPLITNPALTFMSRQQYRRWGPNGYGYASSLQQWQQGWPW